MSEWQPIQTAPKDGSPFLAYTISRAGFAPAPSYRIEIASWKMNYFHAPWGIPTHWMPMPDPPEQK